MDRANKGVLAARNWRGDTLFAAAWLFVAVVGTFDGCFAWHFQADFQEWEMNPWARWLVATFGMGILLSFKAAGMIFAAAVAAACRHFRNRLAMPMTMLIAGVYMLLSLHYVAGYLNTHGAHLPDQVLALARR